MKDYQTIIFDLDGTLTNPEKGITNSLIYALEHFGLTDIDVKDLYKFIGPPLSYSFKTFCHFNEQETQEAITYYRDYFTRKGWAENQLLAGAKDLLQKLKDNHKQLLVASSKPEKFVVQILEHFEISHYFDTIAGATLDDSRSEKADVIYYVLEKSHISDTSHCVMVGDRSHDILGAKANHMDAIGLLLGFGSQKELQEAGATAIAQDFNELERLLL